VTFEYQAAVIGAGPGGYVCAIRLGQLGKKTILIERNKVGGECLNYGCIPTKTLIGAVRAAEKANKLSGHGITGSVGISLKDMISWKDQVVKQLVGGIENLLKANRVETVIGEGYLLDRNRIRIRSKAGGREISAENIVIATGSRPIEIGELPFDHRRVVDNWDILDIEEVPKKLAVIGGGPVGLEFAFLFAKMGSAVTVIEMMDHLLPSSDLETAALIYDSAIKHGMSVLLKSTATSLKEAGESAVLTVKTPEGDKLVECDKVLVSVGRRPASAGIGLENAGVKIDERGFVPVTDQMKTNVENIYALGDVVRGPMLAHRASKQGIVAAEVIAGLKSAFDTTVIPETVFTDPEVASVGMTQEAAVKTGYEVVIGKFPFLALGRAVSTGDTKGFVKIVADAGSGIVLGAQIVGGNASDLISELALAIELGATLEDIALTVHPHPTYPEAIQEASEFGLGRAIHVVNRPWKK